MTKGIPGFLLGAVLGVLGAALAGCQPPEYGPESTNGGGDTATTGTATLTLINQRQTDPGPLTFLLYRTSAQDIENVPPAVTLGTVDFEKARVVSVTAGRWKMAYRIASGDLRPMPPDDDEATSETWPVAGFEKGKSYTLLIETDDGGNTVWRTNIPTVD
jgi:hypothetical protein